jgi:hypothetical protein
MPYPNIDFKGDLLHRLRHLAQGCARGWVKSRTNSRRENANRSESTVLRLARGLLFTTADKVIRLEDSLT